MGEESRQNDAEQGAWRLKLPLRGYSVTGAIAVLCLLALTVLTGYAISIAAQSHDARPFALLMLNFFIFVLMLFMQGAYVLLTGRRRDIGPAREERPVSRVVETFHALFTLAVLLIGSACVVLGGMLLLNPLADTALKPFLDYLSWIFPLLILGLFVRYYKRFTRHMIRDEGGGLYACSDALNGGVFLLLASEIAGLSFFASAVCAAMALVCFHASRGYYMAAPGRFVRYIKSISRKDWRLTLHGAALGVLVVCYAFQAGGPGVYWQGFGKTVFFLWPWWLYISLRIFAPYFRKSPAPSSPPAGNRLFNGVMCLFMFISLPAAATLSWPYSAKRAILHMIYGLSMLPVYYAMSRIFFSGPEARRLFVTQKRLNIASAVFAVFVPVSLFMTPLWSYNHPLRVRVCHHLSEAQCRVIGVDKTPVHENGYFVGYDYSYRTR